MMGRLALLAVTAIVVMASGGCADQTSHEQRNAAAAREATRSRTPSATEPMAERTAEPTAGVGARGRVPGSIRGLVTGISRQPAGGHWITIEKDAGADCGTRAKQRGAPCARQGLWIRDGTVVLRGEGDDARPASSSDIEEGQTVRVFPGNIVQREYPAPSYVADKIVIEGAGTVGRAGTQDDGGPGLFLARQLPASGFATALIRGELVLDEEGCFRIAGRPGGSLVPVWPSGFEARVEGEEVRVLNGRGKTAARVGEGVRAGGGALPSLEELGSVDEETARETQERCPSKEYWLVGGGVRVIPRG